MKNKVTLLSTPFAKSYGMPQLIKESVRFLNTEANKFDMDQMAYKYLLSNVSTITHTHMNALYNNIVSRDMLDSMMFFSFTNQLLTDIPELLTIEDVVIDGKYVDLDIPTNLQKPWINLSPCMRNTTNEFTIVDRPKLVSLVTKAHLCISYNDTQMNREWLPPKISSLIIEFYTMTMAITLSRPFRLDEESTHLIRILFCWYFSSLLGPTTGKIPDLLHRNRFLFKGAKTDTEIADLYDDILTAAGGEIDSIATITKVLVKIGPSRLSKIQPKDVYKVFSLSMADTPSMMIALDYPPYFVHQLLKLVSGQKHPILSTVLRNRFKKPEVMKTMDLLIRDRALFTGAVRNG